MAKKQKSTTAPADHALKNVSDYRHPEATKAKHTAAKRWVEAVNNWGQLRRWAFHVCRNPQLLDKEMEYLARAGSVRSVLDRTFRGEL